MFDGLTLWEFSQFIWRFLSYTPFLFILVIYHQLVVTFKQIYQIAIFKLQRLVLMILLKFLFQVPTRTRLILCTCHILPFLYNKVFFILCYPFQKWPIFVRILTIDHQFFFVFYSNFDFFFFISVTFRSFVSIHIKLNILLLILPRISLRLN